MNKIWAYVDNSVEPLFWNTFVLCLISVERISILTAVLIDTYRILIHKTISAKDQYRKRLKDQTCTNNKNTSINIYKPINLKQFKEEFKRKLFADVRRWLSLTGTNYLVNCKPVLLSLSTRLYLATSKRQMNATSLLDA